MIALNSVEESRLRIRSEHRRYLRPSRMRWIRSMLSGRSSISRMRAFFAIPVPSNRKPQNGLQSDIAGCSNAQPQLVGQVFQPDKALHACKKLQVVHRFGQEIVCPEIQAGDPVRILIQCRHKDNRDMGGGGPGFQSAADFKAIQSRHHYIEQNHIDIAVFADIERCITIRWRSRLHNIPRSAALPAASHWQEHHQQQVCGPSYFTPVKLTVKRRQDRILWFR